jgi:hypothetical protein
VDAGTPDAGCQSSANSDLDADGWTPAQGDCDDCNAAVNPAAVDVAHDSGTGTPVYSDDDCSGTPGDSAATCDDALALDDPNPTNAARALDLCHAWTNKGYGLKQAAYVRANGTPYVSSVQNGIQSAFGPNVHVQAGSRMLVLSNGHARTPADPNACGNSNCATMTNGSAPAGFPQDVPNCPVASNINDDVGLQLVLVSPSNATGFSFDTRFYTFEYPQWACTQYNDQAVVIVSPQPMGSINGNLAFDSTNIPLSANTTFIDTCTTCPNGAAGLQDTGFGLWGEAGATSWLRVKAPVLGGYTFTLRFTIWDSGDQTLDSTLLLDNFQWITSTPVSVSTTVIQNPR